MLLPKDTSSEKSCLRSLLSTIHRFAHNATGSGIGVGVGVFRIVWCLINLLEIMSRLVLGPVNANQACEGRKNRFQHTIGSTGSCLIGSDTSAIEVSVSAPLAREERGAMVYQPTALPRRASKAKKVLAVVVFARDDSLQ